jgi:hypothetical protein
MKLSNEERRDCSEMTTFSEFKERKLERLRLGQATCEFYTLTSDEETRIALVPLTEAEYSNSLHEADKVLAGDNPAGAAYRDEIQRQWVIYFACRDMGDLTVKFFDDVSDVGELDAHDVNAIYDVYLEMVANSSPALVGLSEDDFNGLKTTLPRIAWSELSGPQWYAAQRFLNSIRPLLLMDSFSGSS